MNNKSCMYFHLTSSFLLFIFLFVSNPTIRAQQTVRHLDVDDGLSNSYIKCFAEDNNGCMWVGTESGLNRFDGQRFQIITSDKENLASDANINTLFFDARTNCLWVGTSSKSGCSINTQTGHVTTINHQIKNITGFSPFGKDKLWIATRSNGVWLIGPKHKPLPLSKICPTARIPKECYDIYYDGKNCLYIAHVEDGLSVVNVKTGKVMRYNGGWNARNNWPCARIYNLTPDNLGHLWLSTSNGLTKMDLLTHQFQNYFHKSGDASSIISNHVYYSLITSKKELWAGSDVGGVSIASYTNPADSHLSFRHITSQWNHAVAIASQNIRSLAQDRFGNIWIGNCGRGIDIITHIRPPFKTIDHTWFDGQHLQPKNSWGLYPDKHGNLWIGGDNEICKLNCSSDTLSIDKVYDLKPWLKRTVANVSAIKEDKNGYLLLGLFDDGLLRFKPDNGTCERINIGADHIDVSSFMQEKDGTIRIAAENGAWIYDGTNVLKQDKTIHKILPGYSISAFARDVFGRLWVSSFGKGIIIIDAKGHCIFRWGKKQQRLPSYIEAMILDRQQEIWFATPKGLGHIPDIRTPEQIEFLTQSNGLADNHVRSISEDRNGNIWVGCNKGVSMYNRTLKKFKNYDSSYGIPDGLGDLTVKAITGLPDGRLVFASMSGTFYCSPSELEDSPQGAPIQIIACRSNPYDDENRNTLSSFLSNGSTRVFPYNENNIQITFTASDIALTHLMDFEYMVKGLDQNWIPAKGQNSFTLRNLSPGSYEVKVRGRIKETAWNKDYKASVFITITPPWWLTWWAKTFYTLIAASIAWSLLKAYKRRLKLESSLEIERKTHANEQILTNERIQFYTNITHELRTPLTLILGPLEDLQNSTKLSAEIESKINLVQASAKRMLELVNKLLEFRKNGTNKRQLLIERADLGSFITLIGQRYQNANNNDEVEINCNVNHQGLSSVWFDREAIRCIIDNLMSNAVKYTPKGSITLSAHTVKNNRSMVRIQVIDTGYGIAPEAVPHIFEPFYQAQGKHQASGTGIGLSLVKELVTLHHGTVSVDSIPNQGSTFTVLLPLDDDYPEALRKETQTPTSSVNHSSSLSGDASIPIQDGETEKTANILLIVEDNEEIRTYVADTFRPHYQVIEAKNGEEGTEKALESIPDIIVSDVMMPEMDGFELCQKLKKDLRTCHIPIILLTAKDQTEDRQVGYGCGADSYITKPFSTNLLKSRIDNLLHSRRLLSHYIANHWQTDSMQTQHEHTTSDENRVTEQNTTDEPALSALDQEFIKKLSDFIESHIQDNTLNIDMAAQHMCMSTSTFYRKVKGLTGFGPNQFIRKLRLKYAYQLLVTSYNNVSDAALKSGFNDMRYFRQCFKEEFGKNPSEVIPKK